MTETPTQVKMVLNPELNAMAMAVMDKYGLSSIVALFRMALRALHKEVIVEGRETGGEDPCPGHVRDSRFAYNFALTLDDTIKLDALAAHYTRPGKTPLRTPVLRRAVKRLHEREIGGKP